MEQVLLKSSPGVSYAWDWVSSPVPEPGIEAEPVLSSAGRFHFLPALDLLIAVPELGLGRMALKTSMT